MLQAYHRAGIGVVFMPTILHMKRVPHVAYMCDAEEFEQEELTRYEVLFDKQEDFRTTYPARSPEDVLYVMGCLSESRHSKQSWVKIREMVFFCVCTNAYQSFTCVEAIILSMLFNSELKVLDHHDLNRSSIRIVIVWNLPTHSPPGVLRIRVRRERQQKLSAGSLCFHCSRPRWRAVQSPSQWRSGGPCQHRWRSRSRQLLQLSIKTRYSNQSILNDG
jgi:hypothetical protein